MMGMPTTKTNVWTLAPSGYNSFQFSLQNVLFCIENVKQVYNWQNYNCSFLNPKINPKMFSLESML